MAATVVAAVGLGLVPGSQATASSDVLPLGDTNLTETRVITPLTSGVTLTHIVRGTEPAPADQINTTTRGPWVVNVLTIDPKKTSGHLAATYGPDLAGVETTTDLVRSAGALAGVNASFFTFTASAQYPGDPVGLGLFDGKLLSEPGTDAAEVDVVVDANTNKVVLMGRLQWTGTVKNVRTKATMPLEFINHPPVVPAGCAALTDQTRCTVPGDVVQFTPEFAAATPSGPGVEVVLDGRGCVVRTSTTRGTALTPDQTSLQATGQDALTLLNVANGCVKQTNTLVNEKGNKLNLRPGLFGVNGRYRLTAGGEIVVPVGSPSDSFFARNPRTIVGTTRDGRIVLATIDGRMTSSVGTTMAETAMVADALGLRDAMNLDGGGSTTMSVEGELVNQPSGGSQRGVGDALVFVNGPVGAQAR
ncbi:phosphodiester glycosidase family protein [Micromonospora sp. NBC_01796]|uniref:phosphodiester glycosidase family protein n=1 Tax=Micromonospora sp. NBC_01796 TaxID=2975987 RepID=UPI003FA365D1